jgi:hypothetical protein
MGSVREAKKEMKTWNFRPTIRQSKLQESNLMNECGTAHDG